MPALNNKLLKGNSIVARLSILVTFLFTTSLYLRPKKG